MLTYAYQAPSLRVMETTTLHPFAASPEATEAARKAVQIPLRMLPQLANRAADRLEIQALAILAECALPPRNLAPTECACCGGSLEGMRKGAKFCSADCRRDYKTGVQRFRTGEVKQPASPAHIGSMWSWPEAEMTRYATQEIGYALCNWLRGMRTL